MILADTSQPSRPTQTQAQLPIPDRAGAIAAGWEQRILIVAPVANDARLTAEFLSKAGLSVKICGDLVELTGEMAKGCAALLIAEEVLRPDAANPLAKTLGQQPSWSEIPLVLICSGGERTSASLHRIKELGPVANVSFLERPFRPETLVSTLEVALRSRRRQYEVRDLMAELARARDSAVAASHAKDDFLASLSHELRTPLNPVLLVASEAALNDALPEDVRADFELIARNVSLEARLIDDLLDLTRITRGKLKIERQPQSLHQILDDAIDTVGADVTEKKLALDCRYHAADLKVMGDYVRLEQVFWNVLKNAVKFTPDGGSIHVTTQLHPDGRSVSVVITDTGVGIGPDDMDKIFNAFIQGRHNGGRGGHRFGGLGLGLAISKTLVELHGGAITATSAGRGHGAAFTVELPLASPAVPAANGISNAPVEAACATLRILLVDDHEPSRTSLAQLLRRRQFEVLTAGSVASALELAARSDIDILLSDIGLPDGSGYELMKALRPRRHLKGIAITGYGMDQDISLSKEAGFVTHLTKPVRREALDAALKTVIG
jgi:signal transduction histidine kinase